tara:strand:+ start:160 stop:732 length:573 start_codon:yes stop_codon:yes gene_type:complete
MSIYLKLAKIQKNLKAPKGQWNSFSNFHYRSCENILEGLKLVLDGLVVTMTDDVVMVGDRIYIKATVTLTDGKESVSNTSFAREPLIKKGMDDSQISGTASSYARKYALNGLFLIDDAADPDSLDNSKPAQAPAKKQDDDKEWYNSFDQHKAKMIDDIAGGKKADQIIKSLSDKYKLSKATREAIQGLQS